MADTNELTPMNNSARASNHSTPTYDDLTFNKDHKKPIDAWQRGIIISQKCHSQLAETFARSDRILNTFSLTLTALSSSAIFASVNPPDDWGKNVISYVAGMIAVVSTILQAVHRALQHVLFAEQHKQAAIALTKLRFRLELIVGDNLKDTGNLNYRDLNEWARDYDDALESAPLIPQNYFDAARDIYFENEDKYNRKPTAPQSA